jgi:antitoxin PrlF
MPTSTLTSKGQITLPKQVREQLGLQTGSRVDFVIEPSGRVILKPLNSDFRSLRGIVRSKRKRPVSIEEMNEAIARGFSGT